MYSVVFIRVCVQLEYVRSSGKQSRPPLTEYRESFGRALREVRERVGVSQESLAHDIDMSRRYLSGIERGEANPTLDQIVRLSEGLGVEPGDLMPTRTPPPTT
jgi:ribosome-binding protein aMBF1 (putative translation factor)